MQELYNGPRWTIFTQKFNRPYFDQIYYCCSVTGSIKIGWTLNSTKYRKYLIQQKFELLTKWGYKYRNGPVPGVHNYTNRRDYRGKSLKTEYCNLCDDEYNTVRLKRKTKVRYLMEWDNIRSDDWNKRSWKHKKVKKQYMKNI